MDRVTILNKITNTPLLVSSAHARNVFAYLSKRNGMELIDTNGEKIGAISKMFSSSPSSRNSKPYQVENGIAIITIDGSLAHRYGHIDTYSGVTGYDGIDAKLSFAAQDPDVRGVFLDICSGGGEVSGCFELCEVIQNFSKPTFSFSDGYAYSAAYAIFSSCDYSATTKGGGLGSVGVVIAHTEISKELKSKGKKITLIHSGAEKVDGNPFQALPAQVKAKWQSQIDILRQEFAQVVAVKRAINVESVLATEAALYKGSEALELGLVDFVMSKREAFGHFIETLSNEGTTDKETHMSLKNDVPESTEITEVTEDETIQEVVHSEVSDADRMNEVLASDGFEGNEKLAVFLIANSDMDSSQISEALSMSKNRVNLDLSGAGVEADDDEVEVEAKHPTMV